MSEKVKTFIFPVLKGVLLTLIINLLGVLIFSLIVKLTSLNSSVIKPVNQFIKVLAIFLGCFFNLKGKGGLIKGLIVGVIGCLITYLIFSLIAGGLSFGLSFLLDIIFGVVIGGISGILTVNVRKE